MIELDGDTLWGRVSGSLVNAVRDYLASIVEEKPLLALDAEI